MKRILFWASGMFALGEVAYLYAGRIVIYSIALAMLICLVIIFSKKKKYFARALFMCGLIVLGFGYIQIYDRCSPILFRDSSDNKTLQIEMESYTLYTYGKSDKKIYYIWDDGIVTDISEKDNSITVELGTGFGKYKVIIYQVEGEYILGDRLNISGEFANIRSSTNPGTMDMRLFYRGRGILFYANEKDLDINFILGNESNICSGIQDVWYKILRSLIRIKDNVLEKIYSITDKSTAGFMISILLGDKTYLDEDIKALFQFNGISHILVISGLHISLIGGFIYKVFSVIGINKNIGSLITIVTIILYGNMTGAEYATIRAVIMLVISIMGERLNRDYDMLTSMSLALLIMLMRNPFSILDGGMILSFSAIGGVALGRYFTRVLWGQYKLKKFKKKHPVLYYMTISLIISVSVNVMLTPVICKLYYGFPVFSVLLNIVVIPFMSLIVGLGILGLLLSYISGIWGWLVYIPIKYILKCIVILCELIIKLPVHYVNTGFVSTETIIIYYIGVLFTILLVNPRLHTKLRNYLYEKTHISFGVKQWRIIYLVIWICVSIFASVCISFTHKSNQTEEVVFADVGQGDGTFIRTEEGTNMVIDGGSISNKDVGEYVILPMLKYMNMSKVDYWFVSHGDVDHISGLQYVLEKGELSGIMVKNIVIGTRFQDDSSLVDIIYMAEEQGINVITMKPGDYIMSGDTRIVCLAPDTFYNYEDRNQASMGLSYESTNIKILFTGDMDAEAIEHMVSTNEDKLEVSYDILKVPHHGSRYSVSRLLYGYVQDGFSVISCGEDNSYGHPHEETIEMLRRVESKVLVTKDSGAIIIEIE